jgi:hypothetical protein
MYEYRKLALAQRQKLVEERRRCGHPPHQPPHLALDQTRTIGNGVAFIGIGRAKDVAGCVISGVVIHCATMVVLG